MRLLLVSIFIRIVALGHSVPSQRGHAFIRREAAWSESFGNASLESSFGDPEYLLRVKPFSKSRRSLSFPAKPLFAPSQARRKKRGRKKRGSFAYVTMCIIGQLGARDPANEVMECLNSICSLRKSTPSSQDNIVVLVNGAGVAALREPLKEFGAKLVELPPLQWSQDQKRYPEPKRAYSFYKLHAWRLVGYERVFWFDQDIFFLRDAKEILDNYPGPRFAAAHFPLDAGFCSSKYYINSGVMLFNPSMTVYLQLVDRWMEGNYTPAPIKRGGHGEQDVLCSAFPDILGPLLEMDNCYNYRDYRFQFQRCDASKLVLLHGHHDKKKCTSATIPADLHGLFSFDFSGLRPFVDETLYLRLQDDGSGLANGKSIRALPS